MHRPRRAMSGVTHRACRLTHCPLMFASPGRARNGCVHDPHPRRVGLHPRRCSLQLLFLQAQTLSGSRSVVINP